MPSGLDRLLAFLPSVEDPPPLRSEIEPHIRYVADSRPEFVEPPLSLSEDDLASARVVVISAPAAVGKTMLAEHLAVRTRGTLWNLADFHVGNNFAVGTLAQAHGPDRLGEVLDRLRQGSFLIIADALDEAKLRVSFDAFTAFLDDLVDQLLEQATPGRPPLVLLARAEPAEWAALWLMEAGVSVASIEIDFFDRPEALDFIDRQLQVSGQDPRQQAMSRARDSVVEQLLRVLGVDHEASTWPLDPARRFLGYAPVLVAIARYLARGGNPQRLAEQFAAEGAPQSMWRFLIALVGDILEREQGRFVTGFRDSVAQDANAIGFSDWERVFEPDEQRSWLLSEAFGTDPPAISVPRELEASYRSKVAEWLEVHPLFGGSTSEFASPVFEEFLYAHALVDGTGSEKAAVRRRAAAASYRPTEMLARFLFALTRTERGLDRADLPALYESLAAAEEAGEVASLELSDDEQLEAGITLGDERFELPLMTDGEPIMFTRRLSRAAINLERHDLRLGEGGRTFEIGPDVSLRAPTIEIAAESLIVRGRQEKAGDVVLSADAVHATDPRFQVPRGGDKLKVRAEKESLRWPLTDYALSGDGERTSLTDTEREAAQLLFQIGRFFKSEGYGGLGSYAEPIDRRAGRNERFSQMLGHARNTGLITQEGRIYKLHPETIGLDYTKIKAHVIPAEAVPFLRDFVSKYW